MLTLVNPQRIAKNTLLPYGRMLLIMAVSLYISRVVLNKHGMKDYGIYNIVGGIVTMFAFLNGPFVSTAIPAIRDGEGQSKLSENQDLLESLPTSGRNLQTKVDLLQFCPTFAGFNELCKVQQTAINKSTCL